MHISYNSFALCAALFSSLVAAAPATELDVSGTSETVESGGNITNATSSILSEEAAAKALRCQPEGSHWFAAKDAWDLANWLIANPWTDNVKRNNHITHTWGTARICVNNQYLLEDWGYSRWNQAQMIGYLMASCCTGGQSVCNLFAVDTDDGKSTTGKNPKVFLQAASRRC